VRIRWLAISALAVLFLQLAWPAQNSIYWVVPNFFLIYVILMSIYTDTVRLLWVAFAGGLILDLLAGQGQFGINMAFFILVALFLKLVWQLDRSNVQMASLLLVTSVLTVMYGLVLHASLLTPDYIAQWQAMSVRLGSEVLFNCAVVALSLSVIQLRQRGIISS
jgi:rod shape-determining protein MreD